MIPIHDDFLLSSSDQPIYNRIMINYSTDHRIILTLDTGGTNMVFGAMQRGEFIVEPLTLPAHADNLDLCLQTMVEGFRTIIDQLDERPAAISFAFPGPADYPNGIIGGQLLNFPAFREGVALGPYLKKKFSMPVYINNDGDLYAYGEALGGILPEINEMLDESGSRKRYRNLLGFTLGTGLGIGMVVNGELNRGDNSCIEMFSIPYLGHEGVFAEEGASIRAVKRVYGELSGNPDHGLEPVEIFEIAEGTREGDAEAAKGAFAQMGKVLGDTIAMTVSITDGLVVIGGGLAGAYKYMKDAMFETLRGKTHRLSGEEFNKLAAKVYDLDDPEELRQFLKGEQRSIKIYNSEIEVTYDPQKRIGVALSKIGANKAVSLGAYTFALHQLSR